MVYADAPPGSPSSRSWVAFQNNSNHGFDGATRTTSRSPRRHRGRSAQRAKRDNATVASWMNKPINSDSSWAPVAPPVNDHPTANKRRPPRQSREAPGTGPNRSSNPRDHALRGPNPASTSDSSTSSADDQLRRSKSKSSKAKRGRSSSRQRPPARERSNSVSKRSSRTVPTTSARGRSSSRPPATTTSRQRGRSHSSTRNATTVTRPRSSSRNRTGNRPPPSTSRTRREMRLSITPSSGGSVGPPVPLRRSQSARSSGGADDAAGEDVNIGRDISFGRTASAPRPPTPGTKRSGLMEKLFGDQVPRGEPSPRAGESVSSFVSAQPESIHSRILLTATVYHNTATNLWIATINTNQKGVAKNPATASKYLKAFSFASEQEARESAIANAPPKMLSFEENPSCFVCGGKFAIFRRASHCRNCGVCVCSSCSTTWPSKMIPETYNLKKESQVKICKSCDYLSGAFKKALLDGDYEEAVALYGTGNINLRTPFPQDSKNKEVMYPIHCAVEGGDIEIVQWLMDDHFCPIKVITTGSAKKPKRGGSADTPILTSKGRSVLSIALEGLHVDILRYLVIDNNVSIYESKDLKASLRALEAVLLALPGKTNSAARGESNVPRWDTASYDGNYSITSSLGADQTVNDEVSTIASSKRRAADQCIICYENAIDCVMTPCGHQVCCLKCSANLTSCPVCNVRGEFIKIFRP